MKCNLIIFISSLIVLSICQHVQSNEHYKINFIDVNRNRTELSIVGSKSKNFYIFKAVPGIQKSAIAETVLIEQINATGWGFLYVKSSSEYPDELQAYYSGVAEALNTKPLIAAHWYNTYENYCVKSTVYCQKLSEYLRANLESMIIRSRKNGGYWKMVRLMLWQIKGIQDGFDGKWKKNSTEINDDYLFQLKTQVFQLYLLQADGDLSEIGEILKDSSNYHAKFFPHRIVGDGSCSAMIKYIEGMIFASHVTWSPFTNMLRLTKRYDFPYRIFYKHQPHMKVPGQNLSFSSYPGVIHSIDDFYVTSGGLVTIETTNGNYNKSLWKGMAKSPGKVVLEYLRVQVANRLSTNGPDWIKHFSNHNSGTYNNQWMIVNNNLIKAHKPTDALPDGVLHIAEQLPTLIKSHDVTDYLRKTFWASYNIPFDKEIWTMSGFKEMAAKYGDFFTHDKGPRALIFQRDAPKVNNITSFMKLMRYNNYKHDPLARCACTPPYSGENGISARSDLNPSNGTYPFGALGYRLHGGTDLKITNTILAEVMTFAAISGPTYDQQPVFDWTKVADKTVKHRLQPVAFKFKMVLMPFFN